MTEPMLKQETTEERQKESRIRWTEAERMKVCRRLFALRDVSTLTTVEALDLAQRELPEERKRPFGGSMVHDLRRVYDAWLPKHLTEAHDDRVQARTLLETDQVCGPIVTPPTEDAKVLAEPEVAVVEAAVEPTNRAVDAPKAPPPGIPLGPMELALQRVIGDAVEDRIGVLVREMQAEMQRTREEFQNLLTQQYDAFMCYFDDEYKARNEARAEYIPDPAHVPVLLSQARVRQKKVLISGGQTDQFHAIRLHFKGIEFSFIDGRNPRQVGAGGFYDLVICTKYTNHSARDALIKLHGNRVVMIDGALNNCIAAVKQYLKL